MSCDAYENGVSERFNSVIEAARKKPLITMLEEIWIYVMESTRKHKGFGKWYLLGICNLRAWQLVGYPYVHGYAAISSLNRDPKEYVSEWFTTSMYASCYRYNIRPLNCSAMWPEVDYTKPLPPKKRRLPGRPTMKRKRDQVEREAKGTRHTISKKGMIMRCTICRERGHNRSTCPERPNDVPSTSGKVDLEAELEVEHVVMFKSESDSDFESESDVEANVPEVDVPEPDVEIQDDIQVDANIEDEIQANIEVEHEIEVQDNVEREIQHNAENQVRKRTRKTSERITKIQLRKNIKRKEGSSIDHPLEI
ncbi:unnamed protein product [Lactuca saligna]|uniref:Uncharacterized protein n=1 Tax=Lactuca saligna TaxID=75948 RepID=A0AA35ZB89_LACSI|nr:unnamed protein product [Lactuca saligna]